MATSSRTWFYTTPEPRPYFIEERINHTLWKNRLQGIYMVCTQATSPIQMTGDWYGNRIEFEWVPGNYFTLRTTEERKDLIAVVRQMLMLRPALAYMDEQGRHVIEWHMDGGEARWREIQGSVGYQGLLRLRTDQPQLPAKTE
ncbi:MAG: hypothetical protein ACOYL5_00445 [Phototrophicaceae bacterium]|jgi:hypothetical protein